MRKIPGSLYQIDLTAGRSDDKLNLSIFHQDQLVFQKSGIGQDEIVGIVQSFLEDQDLSIPRNRVDIIIKEELKSGSPKKATSLIEGTVSEMLDEFQKKPPEELKKIVLIGFANAGKTCIYERVFEGKKPHELMQSVATKGISYREYNVGEFTKPMIWDLGGQKQYLDEYHGPMKDSIFQKASVLLYVVDVSDINRVESARAEFEWAATQIISANREANLHVILHKMDLVQDKEAIIQYMTSLFSQNIHHKIHFHATSIIDESLFNAWSEIIQELSSKSSYINTVLKQLKNQDGVRDALLVERRTGLAVGSTFEMSEEEMAVGLFALLVVTIDKVTQNMNLENLKEFRLKTNANYVLLTDVTPNLLLVIILSKPDLDSPMMKKTEELVREISRQLKSLTEEPTQSPAATPTVTRATQLETAKKCLVDQRQGLISEAQIAEKAKDYKKAAELYGQIKNLSQELVRSGDFKEQDNVKRFLNRQKEMEGKSAKI